MGEDLANLEELRRWFPSGTAEGERGILEKVFVYTNEFKDIIAPLPGNPLLLIGKKGSGKSAIIDFALRVLGYQDVPAIAIRPSDIDSSGIGADDAVGDLTRKFNVVLVSSIAAKLSEKPANFLRGDAATLYHEAVNAGKISPDAVGRIANVLAISSRIATKVDLNKLLPELMSSTTREVEEAIANTVADKRFYIFIDDTDQIANPEKPGHLNRIWALILAVRSLTSNIPELRAIISLRTEVWERLRTEAAGQRDQTDHFTNLCIRLSSDEEQVARIIERRLSFAAAACGRQDMIYEAFFSGDVARAPSSEEYRSWRHLITVRSRQRPRDAIQMIGALSTKARLDKKPKIDEDTFRAVMPEFSENRAMLFGQEVERECPQGVDVLRTFSTVTYPQGGFRLTAEEAKSHIAAITSRFGVVIYGTTLRPGNDDHIFILWRFLYISGVLNARISDQFQRAGFNHVDADRDPMLVSKARWNQMQQMLWEVNTAFRDFLVSLQQADRARTGLPIRMSKRKRR